MKIKKINQFSLPELWFWTWPMWWYKHKIDWYDDTKDIETIDFLIENWITHFDTAELYWTWAAEEILWKAIKKYPREKFQIASKVKWSNCSYNAIKIACKKSLTRLWIDYLDLYYIHWRDKKFDLKDVMKAMDELKNEWLIKNIWVSNFSLESLKGAQSYTKNKIVANQVHYNLIYREPEKELLKYCQENDILLVAWRPIELWKLANSWTQALVETALKYKKTHSQIAINFLTSQKNVVTIFHSTDKNHILENLWALWWHLKDEDLENLRKNFSGQVWRSDVLFLW